MREREGTVLGEGGIEREAERPENRAATSARAGATSRKPSAVERDMGNRRDEERAGRLNGSGGPEDLQFATFFS